MAGVRKIKTMCYALVWVGTVSGYADYSESWGLRTGSPIPKLEFTDQYGVPRDFPNLVGERGLLIFFARSSDW